MLCALRCDALGVIEGRADWGKIRPALLHLLLETWASQHIAAANLRAGLGFPPKQGMEEVGPPSRGRPTTTFNALAVRSHKTIIAAETGLCKGYGFLLYTSRDEAERAIGCLSRMGLQASFAKESFSARLRRMADKGSSNVYLSNLPTDMTTHQLEHLFAPHNVISMRILLNSDGTSRGVGFVRL
ncbi:hypothetical protein OC835_007741, partial [Tilletia horrida]